MINDLQELSNYFSKMDEKMVEIYQKVFNKMGLTEDVVLKQMNEELN